MDSCPPSFPGWKGEGNGGGGGGAGGAWESGGVLCPLKMDRRGNCFSLIELEAEPGLGLGLVGGGVFSCGRAFGCKKAKPFDPVILYITVLCPDTAVINDS